MPMNILLATDGSECSRVAVDEIAHRPWPHGTHIEVVAVVDIGFQNAPQLGPISPEYFNGLEQALEENAALALRDAEARLAPCKAAGVEIGTKRLLGPPALTILDEAEASHADLVVVGSHGRGALKRLVLGSVSHAVVMHAKCSVEVVRRHAA
jgi:nucleotide-binding universal stress UspA family protein